MKRLPSKLIPLIRSFVGADFKQAPIWCRSKSIKPAQQAWGFTLIEIIIFIVLVGVFMVGIMSPFLTSVSRSGQPEIVASAAFLATERMEELQQVAYSTIASDASAITLTGNYTPFSRQVTVTLVDANLAVSATDVGYKRVVVTVFHNQLPAAGISVTSLFTDYAG